MDKIKELKEKAQSCVNREYSVLEKILILLVAFLVGSLIGFTKGIIVEKKNCARKAKKIEQQADEF